MQRKTSQNNPVPKLDEDMFKIGKSITKDIDPDLEPIYVSGAWHLDGMISESIFDNKRMGNVNIGNRIFTDDMVTLLGNGKYKISPKSGFYSENQNQALSILVNSGFFRNKNMLKSDDNLVRATIDGIEYQGKEIFIDKRQVSVDNIIMTNVSERQEFIPK